MGKNTRFRSSVLNVTCSRESASKGCVSWRQSVSVCCCLPILTGDPNQCSLWQTLITSACGDPILLVSLHHIYRSPSTSDRARVRPPHRAICNHGSQLWHARSTRASDRSGSHGDAVRVRPLDARWRYPRHQCIPHHHTHPFSILEPSQLVLLEAIRLVRCLCHFACQTHASSHTACQQATGHTSCCRSQCSAGLRSQKHARCRCQWHVHFLFRFQHIRLAPFGPIP